MQVSWCTAGITACVRMTFPGTLSAMRIVGIGIDLIECQRVRDILDRHGERLTERLLTDAEWAYVQKHRDVVPRLAGRFAAKEAVLKVLGTGWRGKIAWRDIEILNNSQGCPSVTLSGECKAVAEKMGINEVLISITHTENYGAATALAQSNR